jgi:hypothetical protein
MQGKKTIILAQFFISLMMCCLMTGYATIWVVGFNPGFFGFWAHSFITAWPVAFILAMICGGLGFKLAAKITGVPHH